MGERVKRLEQAIVEVVKVGPAAVQEVIRGLQALRGMAHFSAVTIVVELGTCSNARLLRDFFQAGIGALPGKGCLRDFKNALTVAQRVCARFPGGRGMFLHHPPKILATGGYLRLSIIRRPSPF